MCLAIPPSSTSCWAPVSMSTTKPMDAHTRMDSDLHAHGTIPTASTIQPIEDWSTDDVWTYLLKLGLGQRHAQPLCRYQPGPFDALPGRSGRECPVIHDPSQQTCAGSRFGCWTTPLWPRTTGFPDDRHRERHLRRHQTGQISNFPRPSSRRAKPFGKPSSRAQPTWRRWSSETVQRAWAPTTQSGLPARQVWQDLLSLQEEYRNELITPEEIAFIHKTWDEEIVNLARLDSEDKS